MKPLCGTKLSLCCMILSVWGVLQLAIMGVLYHVGAVGLIEDVEEGVEEAGNADKIIEAIEKNYKAVAVNCWIASVVYLFIFAFAMTQYKCAQRVPQEVLTNDDE